MNKKTVVMTMKPGDETLHALRALDLAGLQLFAEVVDTRDKWEIERGAGKKFRVQFFTLNPNGI